jgi:hypothetical protein
MRTKALFLTAAVVAAGVATSLADVYSLNVVGYVNRVFPAGGKYTLVANPLNGSSNTLGGVIAAALPTGSKVLKWGGTGFVIYTRAPAGDGFIPGGHAATETLNPGEGFFVQTPVASTTDITNTFVGEVLQGNLTNTYPAGFTLSGNLVPDSGVVSSLQLTNVPTGSKLLTWDPVAGGYTIYTKGPTTVWLPSAPSINVADGFFVNAASTFSWVWNFTVQ